MKDATYVGHSDVKFDKQWSISAQVALAGGPSFNYIDSVLDISTKQVADLTDWHILEGYDCPGHDSPDSPINTATIYDCIDICLGFNVSFPPTSLSSQSSQSLKTYKKRESC